MNRWRLGFVAAAAFMSSGCITQTTLGRLHTAVRPEEVLVRPEITGLIGRGIQVGEIILGGLTVILAFTCWFRATQGTPFVALAKEWIVGVGIALWILTTVRSGLFGPVRWIYESGQYLGQLFGPANGFFMANHDLAVGRMAQFLQMVQTAPGGTPSTAEQAAVAMSEGLAFILMNPVAVVGVLLNSIALHLFKLVLQVSYTFLLIFYWTLTPIVAPTLVLPQTRHIFIGWVKSYVSIALWPFFFAIVEQLAIAIPWASWLGIENILAGGDILSGLAYWSQGQLMLLVLNIAFLGVYASIPIVSNRIVTGAAQPFRAGLL
jgi:hypothetical protein